MPPTTFTRRPQRSKRLTISRRESVSLDTGSILKLGCVAGAVTFALWVAFYLIAVVLLGLGAALLA